MTSYEQCNSCFSSFFYFYHHPNYNLSYDIKISRKTLKHLEENSMIGRYCETPWCMYDIWCLHLPQLLGPLQQPLQLPIEQGNCGGQREEQGDLPRKEWAGELQILGDGVQIWPGFPQPPQHPPPPQLRTSVVHGGGSHLVAFLTRGQWQQERDGTTHSILALFRLGAHDSFGSGTSPRQQQP